MVQDITWTWLFDGICYMTKGLAVRIFFIFHLFLALMFMLMLLLLKFNYLQTTKLLENEWHQIVMLQQHAKAELITINQTNYLVWWRKLFYLFNQWILSGQYFILIADRGSFIGAQNNEIPIIRNFTSQLNNIDYPQKTWYGHKWLVDPFIISNSDNYYQFYQTSPSNNIQLYFIVWLLICFLLLLIIIMFISIMLLICLAYILCTLTHNLKYIFNKGIRNNLRYCSKLSVTEPYKFWTVRISHDQVVNNLEQIVATQQRLLSDISHELYAPLTRLQLATALLRRRYGEGFELTRIKIEAQRLESMINDLLVLFRNQHKDYLLNKILNANDLWLDMLNDATFEAEQIGKSLKLMSPPGNWRLIGNPSVLNSALENVIRNALRYSYQRIMVWFSACHEGITIIVDDDGPGISEDDYEIIFRPFYRSKRVYDHVSNGNGLGLAIVKTAVMQHHGWVKATNSPLGGLRLIIWFPLLGQY